ncbi:family 20 glycosylhydrolase [Mediterranea massiliensis]|uniref:beta-N-acetylhexosaminidase n=1 Tax=Mediterranea massiliensis TaxID=1841865 RepID=UPI0023F58582|nr:family 20 glycosylhydrolase [Mediterranea massiliensis]
MKIHLTMFLSCLLVMGCGSSEQKNVLLIPQPQTCEVQSGTYSFATGETFYSNLSGTDKSDLAAVLESSPFGLKASDDAQASFRFEQVDSLPGMASDEGYRLTVDKKGVRAEATTPAGLFYAFQSLLQMAEAGQQEGGFTLPCASLSDYPRFSYRGLHLDVSRHFRSKEFVMKQLDAMARYKLNRLHWHLTDGAGWRLEIKHYPQLTEQAAYRPYPNWKAWWTGGRKYCRKDDPGAEGGYYTQDDVREILEHARKLHITVIPEIEMPGHSEEVLAVFPQLSCSGKPYQNGELCIGNEETFTFLENVLLEVMDLFPSEYIHIGGDEAAKSSWEKCPKCQARIRKEGLKDEKELQSYLIHRIEKFLNDHGRKLIGWDEILEGGLAPSATVMSWRGEQGGITAAKAGHDVIMTPGEFCYLDAYQDAPGTQPEAIGGYLTLEKVYSYNPVPAELTEEQKPYIKGVQANVWTEYIPTEEHAEYMIYPRLLALSEVAWTEPGRKDWPRFREAALKEVKWLQSQGYHPFDLEQEVGERPEARQPAEHLALHKKVTYAYPYAPQYPSTGETALTDGIRGGWTYGDKRWQGFLCKDADVTIDLEKVTDIKLVEADFMQLRGPEIWLPKEVVISVSEDGKQYQELKRIATEVPVTEEKLVIQKYRWEGTAKARYVHFQGLLNREVMGWMFVDEIVVK